LDPVGRILIGPFLWVKVVRSFEAINHPWFLPQVEARGGFDLVLKKETTRLRELLLFLEMMKKKLLAQSQVVFGNNCWLSQGDGCFSAIAFASIYPHPDQVWKGSS
jgi:hypothetical protein